MQLSTTQLSRMAIRGEEEVSINTPFLVDRFSPDILSGTAVYDMPIGVLSIKRVTWLGRKIEPYDHRRFRENTLSTDQAGLPFSYIFNNIGRLQVQFYYIPNTDIDAGVGDLWAPSVIKTCVVIEYWKIADGVNFKLPDYYREQLLKYYLAYQSNKVEGTKQQIQMAQYFKQRWELSETVFKQHVQSMINTPRKIALTDVSSFGVNGINRRLPANYWPMVDE